MGTFILNGVKLTGNNICIRNNRVVVDGTDIADLHGKLSGVVEIKVVDGLIYNLETEASVNCEGITGDVNAGGSVNCGGVGGNITAGGAVRCNK